MNQPSDQAGEPRRLLILLLGGRPAPGMLLALQLQPAAVTGLCSTDTVNLPEIRALMPDLENLLKGVQTLPVEGAPPYRVRANLVLLEQALARARERYGADLQPVLGIAGAPVPMTIAAYETARSWGCPCYYVNTGGSENIDLTNPDEPDTMHVRVGMPPFVSAASGLSVSPARSEAPSGVVDYRLLKEAALRLMENVGQGSALMGWLRNANGATAGFHKQTWPATLGSEHWKLLQTLHERGILIGLSRQGGTASWTVPDKNEAAFIGGGWLEIATYEAALAEKSLFDVCWRGLTLHAPQPQGGTQQLSWREVDFVGLRGGRSLIASCKAEAKPWTNPNLDEINSCAQLMGGNYCTRLLIADLPRPNAVSESDFLRRAEYLRIVLVGADELPMLGQVLRREVERPTYVLK